MDSSSENIQIDIKSEQEEAEQEEWSSLNRIQMHIRLEDFQNLQSTTNHQPNIIKENMADQSESSRNYWCTNDLEIIKVLSKTMKSRLESSYPTDRENLDHLLQQSIVAIQKLNRILEFREQNCHNDTSYSGSTDCTISQLQEPTYNRCSPQELNLQKAQSKIIHPPRNNPSFLNNRADNNLISASPFPRTSSNKIDTYCTFRKMINTMKEWQRQIEQWKIRRKLVWTERLQLRKAIQELIDQIRSEILRLEKTNVKDLVRQILSNSFNEQLDNNATEPTVDSETSTEFMIPTYISCMMNSTSNNTLSAPQEIKTKRKSQRKRKFSWISSESTTQNNTVRSNIESALNSSETLLNSFTFNPIQKNTSTSPCRLGRSTNFRFNICNSESSKNLNKISHTKSKKSVSNRAIKFSHFENNFHRWRDPITGRFISKTHSSISPIPGPSRLGRSTNYRLNNCDSESSENLNKISHTRSKKSPSKRTIRFSHLENKFHCCRDPITGRFISRTHSSKLNQTTQKRSKQTLASAEQSYDNIHAKKSSKGSKTHKKNSRST